ncbi:bifunctional serine/threonine-protein phosphatase/kinase [Ideonella azotifigens]|uniref:Bifunctional protein-serine/threonine kinase/phosphatase n=1 Tax=Ideonella azotifigens TaxID=513160 RepID=A0ABN1KB27_9BURK|nr:bifunctional protein-serine/threonine kinase/phosphatase [Ideonella azotifigens]MCD2338743.1 bifunctional serine/threonine-protein phosphatase/kinase [Ideonella azotifigens]
MSFEVDIGCCSERGARPLNEDFAGAVRAQPHEAARGLIAAVADGVSAGGLGREAAQTTVMGLLSDFFAAPATWETSVVLDRLVSAQNAWLAGHNRRRNGRGSEETALTTLTALALHGQTWTLAHVGDTRAWLLRRGSEVEGAPEAGELTQLSHDHAFDHPDQRSRLTRAVGLDDAVRIDFAQGDVHMGDCFLMTSDGVHGVLKPARIAALLGLAAEADAQTAADAMVQAARDAGSRDNLTALVLRVTGLDARQLHDEWADAKRLPVLGVLQVGDGLDGYQVTARVADTGVHLIYQARDRQGQLVALKTLHPSRASDPEERAMLAHEAWLGQRVSDRGEPGFVRVLPRGADASALYTVFEWHSGRTLAQRMEEGQRPGVSELLAAAQAWAEILSRLHRQGVIHRDVKPGNLHLGDDGQWRLLDLGVAVSGRESAAQRELHAGTPSYMNPEQWQGGVADAGSDLFALGVTLYQWLTGRLPYGEVEPWQTGGYRRDPQPASRLRPDVPIWLDHLLAKAVARDAAQRFETADELLLALQRGAARPVSAPAATPLMQRDPAALLKLALGLSLLLNFLLVFWLLFLPR